MKTYAMRPLAVFATLSLFAAAGCLDHWGVSPHVNNWGTVPHHVDLELEYAGPDGLILAESFNATLQPGESLDWKTVFRGLSGSGTLRANITTDVGNATAVVHDWDSRDGHNSLIIRIDDGGVTASFGFSD